MTQLLINIDVPDLDAGVRFYTAAFDLQVSRRLGSDVVELSGAQAPIYLLAKPAGTTPSASLASVRDYARHWTPVHLDFVVEDLEAALLRAETAGAKREAPISEHAWGRLALLSDPFGHGLCLLQFKNRGYAELVE